MGEEKKTILKKIGAIKRIKLRKKEIQFTPPKSIKNQELEKILASFDEMELDVFIKTKK